MPEKKNARHNRAYAIILSAAENVAPVADRRPRAAGPTAGWHSAEVEPDGDVDVDALLPDLSWSNLRIVVCLGFVAACFVFFVHVYRSSGASSAHLHAPPRVGTVAPGQAVIRGGSEDAPVMPSVQRRSLTTPTPIPIHLDPRFRQNPDGGRGDYDI